MIPSMLNQSLDETNKCDLSGDKIFAANDKIQEDLANKLRSLIANFCDEHFVKYLKDPKNTNKSDNEHPVTTTPANDANNESESSDNKTTSPTESAAAAADTHSESNNIEMTDIESEASNNKTELPIDNNTAIKDSELNLTSSSSLTPPRSSYSSTSSSSSSSSPSSDNAIANSVSEEANKFLNDHDTESSLEENPIINSETTNKPEQAEAVALDSAANATSLNDVIDKLEIIDHASKSVKEISSSAELNHHRLQHIVLDQLKEKATENSALEKLWSQVLIGADKLEIFGSIHVRSNNVRLFSCLIDEQLHIDNQNFSSASSCVSQDSCSPKVKQNAKLQSLLRGKNYYKYEKQLAMANNHFYRRKLHHDAMTYKRYATSLHKKSRSCMQICCQPNDSNLFDLEHQANYNHYYQMKRQHKQQKLAKKVEDIAKAATQEANNEEHYPMKKFKAYHSYCSNKRKSDIKPSSEKQIEEPTENMVTSLSSLATVAAAAMRLSPTEAPVSVTHPVKKSRKSSVTNSIKQVKPHMDADTELEINDEEDLNNSLIIDQSNGKLNDFYLYEGEEDFGDSSSIISGSSSFTSSRHSLYEKSKLVDVVPAAKHRHHRQHSAHSHCSSYMSGEHEGLSSRSTSLNGDCMSRAKIPTKIATANHRSVSPASSLASSSFDYNDEQAYQSYCSTSSFKSDFEDDFHNDEFPRKHHHHQRRKDMNKTELVNDENDKPDNVNNVTTDDIIEDKQEDQRIATVNPNSRHYHRRKQHLMDADLQQKQSEIDEPILKKQIKTEKDQINEKSPIHQNQLKLQQLPSNFS